MLCAAPPGSARGPGRSSAGRKPLPTAPPGRAPILVTERSKGEKIEVEPRAGEADPAGPRSRPGRGRTRAAALRDRPARSPARATSSAARRADRGGRPRGAASRRARRPTRISPRRSVRHALCRRLLPACLAGCLAAATPAARRRTTTCTIAAPRSVLGGAGGRSTRRAPRPGRRARHGRGARLPAHGQDGVVVICAATAMPIELSTDGLDLRHGRRHLRHGDTPPSNRMACNDNGGRGQLDGRRRAPTSVATRTSCRSAAALRGATRSRSTVHALVARPATERRASRLAVGAGPACRSTVEQHRRDAERGRGAQLRRSPYAATSGSTMDARGGDARVRRERSAGQPGDEVISVSRDDAALGCNDDADPSGAAACRCAGQPGEELLIQVGSRRVDDHRARHEGTFTRHGFLARPRPRR